MNPQSEQRIASALGSAITGSTRLLGGCIGEVYRVQLSDDRSVVVKVAAGAAARLSIEGFMLRYLAARGLPVPEVLVCDDDLLVMEYVEGRSSFSADAQRHAAELLAALHGVTGPAHGFESATLIGGLEQPNPWTDSWLEFFGRWRLVYMAEQAAGAGKLAAASVGRVAKLADRLGDWLKEPHAPALIHGDVWTTNVLADGNRITAFLDPAISYADPEIELAFITLFSTFGEPFFERYGELRPIRPGFWERRRDLYNLYPLLVHARLFGGGYAADMERVLDRFGV
jgi:fructosamine-3-kinase